MSAMTFLVSKSALPFLEQDLVPCLEATAEVTTELRPEADADVTLAQMKPTSRSSLRLGQQHSHLFVREPFSGNLVSKHSLLYQVNATCQSPLVGAFSPAGKPVSIPPSESILGRSHHKQASLQRQQETTKALLLSASHAYSDHALVYATSHVD